MIDLFCINKEIFLKYVLLYRGYIFIFINVLMIVLINVIRLVYLFLIVRVGGGVVCFLFFWIKFFDFYIVRVML